MSAWATGSCWRLPEGNFRSKVFDEDLATVLDLLDLGVNLNHQRIQLLQMMLTTDRSEQEALAQDIRQRVAEIDQSLQRIQELHQGDPVFIGKLGDLSSTLSAYRQTRDQQINLVFEGKVPEARQLGVGIQEERFEEMRSLALELGQSAQRSARDRVSDSGQRANELMLVFVILSSVAALVALGLTVLLTRIIAQPLRQAAAAAEQIAGGDLTVRVPYDARTDEVGVLGQSFRSMVGNLQSLISDIGEGINVLAASSSEILAASTQVAAGATETAVAVSQTAATVGEVRQTALLSSDKAKYVSEVAKKASQVSQDGRKAVEDAIAGMARIQEQSAYIAEAAVKLSEQSQAIGEIIATVNDLAEQSNLLAINAAIEAAKASEHGRGFGVVAQEVKSLAEQSKQATAQVRAILGEVQKATTAVVMTGEQGMKAVETGVQQSTQAGESIRMLAGSVSEAATQIAASSQQQLAGMDQVAVAIDNVNQASAQNAASTRQAEAAAQGPQDLGQKLKQLHEQFTV